MPPLAVERRFTRAATASVSPPQQSVMAPSRIASDRIVAAPGLGVPAGVQHASPVHVESIITSSITSSDHTSTHTVRVITS